MTRVINQRSPKKATVQRSYTTLQAVQKLPLFERLVIALMMENVRDAESLQQLRAQQPFLD